MGRPGHGWLVSLSRLYRKHWPRILVLRCLARDAEFRNCLHWEVKFDGYFMVNKLADLQILTCRCWFPNFDRRKRIINLREIQVRNLFLFRSYQCWSWPRDASSFSLARHTSPACLSSNRITRKVLDQRARAVLNLVNRCAASKVPEYAKETTNDSPETSTLLRKVASNAIVLMKNDNGILPLKKDKSVRTPVAKKYCTADSWAH